MDARCQETREMAAELALGIVEGEERGRALQHLAECPDCRAEVEKYSEVADDLLLLAPHREAPVGFESRVLNELLPAPQPRRRRAPAAARPRSRRRGARGRRDHLVVVAPGPAACVQLSAHPHQANGKEFESYLLQTEGGVDVGTVFSYSGSPSWVHIDVDPGHRVGADQR